MRKVRTDIVADCRVPLVFFDEFYRLRSVVDAPLRDGSIERIPLRLRYGLRLVPVAPENDPVRHRRPENLALIVRHELLQFLVRAERDTRSTVQVAIRSLRKSVQVELAPMLRREIPLERIRLLVFPHAHTCFEANGAVPAGPVMAPYLELHMCCSGIAGL